MSITSRGLRRPEHHEFYKTCGQRLTVWPASRSKGLFEHFLTMSSTALAQGVKTNFSPAKIDDHPPEAEYMRAGKNFDSEHAKIRAALAILTNTMEKIASPAREP